MPRIENFSLFLCVCELDNSATPLLADLPLPRMIAVPLLDSEPKGDVISSLIRLVLPILAVRTLSLGFRLPPCDVTRSLDCKSLDFGGFCGCCGCCCDCCCGCCCDCCCWFWKGQRSYFLSLFELVRLKL